MMTNPDASHIRSYVLRSGRLTSGQAQAMDEHYARFGLSLAQLADLSTVFDTPHPIFLEIGFGTGEVLLNLAKKYPERNFIGVEVHKPGVGHLLHQLVAEDVENVRVVSLDVIDVLAALPANALAGVLLFFPDPWPKRKHRKRRLVRPEVVQAIATILQSNGHFFLATDWEDYAQQMLKVVESSGEFMNEAGEGQFSQSHELRSSSRFERRGKRLGHGVWDLIFRKPTMSG